MYSYTATQWGLIEQLGHQQWWSKDRAVISQRLQFLLDAAPHDYGRIQDFVWSFNFQFLHLCITFADLNLFQTKATSVSTFCLLFLDSNCEFNASWQLSNVPTRTNWNLPLTLRAFRTSKEELRTAKFRTVEFALKVGLSKFWSFQFEGGLFRWVHLFFCGFFLLL